MYISRNSEKIIISYILKYISTKKSDLCILISDN